MTENTINTSLWVDNYADQLYHFALARTGNHALSKDLVQDTFLSGLKAIDTFAGKSKESTWLYAILKNKIIDHYRKASTQREINQLDNDEFNTDKYFSDSPSMKMGFWRSEGFLQKSKDASQLIQSKEFNIALEDCLSNISYKAQMAFRLKHIQGIETEEICKELEISSSNYWVLLHRARLQLRDCLNKKGAGK